MVKDVSCRSAKRQIVFSARSILPEAARTAAKNHSAAAPAAPSVAFASTSATEKAVVPASSAFFPETEGLANPEVEREMIRSGFVVDWNQIFPRLWKRLENTEWRGYSVWLRR